MKLSKIEQALINMYRSASEVEEVLKKDQEKRKKTLKYGTTHHGLSLLVMFDILEKWDFKL